MVIGANVGTTSTAVFAAVGATPNARRVATAHVIFNVINGILALLILPAMLWVVDHAGRCLNLESLPAITLAVFHTLFNALGVLLLRRFTSAAEALQQPRFIDATTSGTPALALDAITMRRSTSVATPSSRFVTRRAMRYSPRQVRLRYPCPPFTPCSKGFASCGA